MDFKVHCRLYHNEMCNGTIHTIRCINPGVLELGLQIYDCAATCYVYRLHQLEANMAAGAEAPPNNTPVEMPRHNHMAAVAEAPPNNTPVEMPRHNHMLRPETPHMEMDRRIGEEGSEQACSCGECNAITIE
ncbi:uncharacterized protein [Periplaneta americana]|uniref:uncharacterized protein n=1 Tax=Periplaneta americana TaxID=6978 RepID=UPI0037E97D4E